MERVSLARLRLADELGLSESGGTPHSSENQRPESIEDQISSCRKLAAQLGYSIIEEHIYTDKAASGASEDRPGLDALMDESDTGRFGVVLVDDLSRLVRDNFLMLSLIAQLRFNGVSIVSVADGLDSEDEESNLARRQRQDGLSVSARRACQTLPAISSVWSYGL